MRICAVEVTPVAVPYRPEVGPIVTSKMVLTEARHVIVRVGTDEGVWGLGEALSRPASYGETVESITAALTQLIVPLVLGLDPCAPERLWSCLNRIGANTTAKAAVDMACHDIVGRVAGQPLYKLLGGWSDGQIPLTMPIAIAPEEEVVRQAQNAVAAGFRSVKLKVGKDVRRDVRIAEAVREAIGADIVLYVDANQGYSTTDALKAVVQYERLGIDLFEEPVAGGNVDGRVKLSRSSSVPLLLDESIQGVSDALREIGLGTAGAFSIRSPRSGIAWSRKLVGIAEAAGVPCLAGSHRELGVGTAASAHLAAAFAAMSLPAELGVHTLLTDGLLMEPLVIENGVLTIPSGPGLGVEIDPDRLERYRIAETIVLTSA